MNNILLELIQLSIWKRSKYKEDPNHS